MNQKEFEIKPAKDILPPRQTMVIDVIFISLMPKKYDMVMVVDLDGIGQDMQSLMIKAESEVPTVKIEPVDLLNFGTIFLRNPDVAIITLSNDSPL